MTVTETPKKRGPVPTPGVVFKVKLPLELNDMLDQIVRSTGISKGAVIRDAVALYGEHLGLLADRAADQLTPTRTTGLGTRGATRRSTT